MAGDRRTAEEKQRWRTQRETYVLQNPLERLVPEQEEELASTQSLTERPRYLKDYPELQKKYAPEIAQKQAEFEAKQRAIRGPSPAEVAQTAANERTQGGATYAPKYGGVTGQSQAGYAPAYQGGQVGPPKTGGIDPRWEAENKIRTGEFPWADMRQELAPQPQQQAPAPQPQQQAPAPQPQQQAPAPQPQQQSGGYGTTQAEQVAAANKRTAEQAALPPQSPAAQAQAAAEERAAKLGDLQKQQWASLPEWMKQTNSGQAAAEREAKLAAERKQQGLERPPGPEATTNAPQPAPAAAAPPPPPPPPPPPAPTIGLASPAAKPAETAASSPVQIMQQAAQARPATGWADTNAPGSLARNLGSRNPPPSFSALTQAMQQRGRAY